MDVAAFAGLALAYAAVALLSDPVAAALGGEVAAAVAAGSLVLSAVLVVGLAVFGVRAYRATVARARAAAPVEAGDKALLVAALWFAAGLPLCVGLIARGLASGAADLQRLWVQLAVSAVLLALSCLRFRK